jgi:outer membrane protein W
MKKIVCVIALAMICSGAFAQFNKGRMLVGGAFGFSATTSKDKSGSTTTTYSHNTNFSLTPNFGYFLMDNLAVGAGIGLSTSSTKGAGNNNFKNTSSGVTLSPFARYYLDPGIFFQAQLGFGSSSFKSSSGGSTSSKTQYGLFNWSLGAGYAYFLTDNVAVEPMIGFRSSSQTNKDNTPKTKSTDAGPFLSVGFQIYLGARN